MSQSFNLTARINLQGPYNLKPIIAKIKSDLNSIKPELKFKLDPSAAQSVSKVTSEIKKLNTAVKSANSSVGSLNSQLQQMAQAFNSLSSSSNNAAQSTASVAKSTTSAAKAANQARTAIEEFGKQSGLAIKRFAAFSSVTTVIYGVTNAINSAFQEFLSFNQELVKLSQVTNKSVSELGGITGEITKLSTSLGVASSDLVTVASTLAQAGLSAEDTKIALEALAKSSLAPSFDNITETTEGAIAAIRQFGLQTKELDSALGSINSVAAAFAVESKDIITAIQRTGGVFASSSRGVSEGTNALNEFIAIFTSVRQTTRESAETIATGLRTIFTRIQRASTIELLKEYGVELRDLEGKFVGPYEAVKRLSEGLSKIDPRSADFAKISEELGGFRQISKVIPLIQQFSVAQQALGVAQRGSGSLAKDAEIAQQSLSVQFAKTRENFLALVRDVANSQSFKVFVGTTLTLTNALINLGQALKPLLPLLLTFTGIKIGSSLTQFSSGFGMAFNRGGGGPGGSGPGGGVSPSGGGGGGGGQPLTSALALNTSATTTLNNSILALNQNIVNTNSLLLNRPLGGKFASGGLVPGSGNSDTYGAVLTPGEFVIRKKAVESIGVDNLHKLNKYAGGGRVNKFARGGIANAPMIDDITQTTGSIPPRPEAIEQLIRAGGGAVDLDRTLKRTIGDKAYSKATTPISQKSVLGRFFTDEAARLQDVRTAPLTSFGKALQQAINSGSLKANRVSIISKSRRTRGVPEYLSQLFGIPVQNMVFTQGGDKQSAMDAIRSKGPRVDRVGRFNFGGMIQRFMAGSRVKTPIDRSSKRYKTAVKNRIGEVGNIREFGLVALQSGLKESSSIPEIFTEDHITPITKTPVKIKVGLLSKQNAKQASDIENIIKRGYTAGVKRASKILSSSFGSAASGDDTEIQKIIDNAGFYNVIGAGLEAAIGLSGANFFAKSENTKAIDFPLGLGRSSALFGDFPSNIPTDVTRTVGGYGKGIGNILSQAERYLSAEAAGLYGQSTTRGISPILQNQLSDILNADINTAQTANDVLESNNIPLRLTSKNLKGRSRQNTLSKLFSLADNNIAEQLLQRFTTVRRNSGGDISGEDTVHALLTPGEFVFNKKAAQKIGYNNLEKLNKADKLPGFNKGGVVKFASGGNVATDPVIVASALSSVLLPEIQKLASTFGELNGSVGDFGTALGGAIREASSLVLSANIALKAVGASKTTSALTQGIGGLSAATGGAISDVASRLLAKELLNNTKAIGAFNQSIQDYNNASTEELKIEAAKKVEQSFITLDSTLRASKPGIDNLEKLNNIGKGIDNVTSTILSTVTAMVALSSASRQAALSIRATARRQAAGLATDTIGMGTKVLSGLSKFLGPIGLLISAVSIGAEIFSYFNTRTKSTDEQFSRLNETLQETIQVSNNYNLANQNFIDNILPKFRQLVENSGSNTKDIVNSISSNNDLNLTRDFLIRTSAAQKGLSFRSTESLTDVQKRIQGNGILEGILANAIEEANNRYIVEGFVASRKSTGLSLDVIQKEFDNLGGVGSAAVKGVAMEYFGELDRRRLVERNLAAVSSELKINLVNLSTTVSNIESIFNKSLSNLNNNFQALSTNIDIILGSPTIQGGVRSQKDIQILENLKQASEKDIVDAFSRLRSFSNIENPTSDQFKALAQMQNAIQANAILQQRTDIVLNKIAQQGLNSDEAARVLASDLQPILENAMGGDRQGSETLIRELTAAIQVGGAEGKPITSFDQAATKIEGFGTLLDKLNSTTQSTISIFKSFQQAEQTYAQSLNERLNLDKKFTELAIQRRQTEIINNNELKRILGERVSLEDVNSEFFAQINELGMSAGIGGINTKNFNISSVDEIGRQLDLAKQQLAKRVAELSNSTGLMPDSLKTIDSSYLLLNKKVSYLQQAMDLLANSGILVKNTFEQIAKDKDLLKSQDQLLFELLRDSGDPTKSFELDRIINAVMAVDSGRANREQLILAGERGVSMVRAGRGEVEAEKFFEKVRSQLVDITKPTNQSQAQARDRVIAERLQARYGMKNSANNAMSITATAQDYLLTKQADALKLSLDQTSSIFNIFNNEIKTRLDSLFGTIFSISNNVSSKRTTISETSVVSNELQTRALEAIKTLLEKQPTPYSTSGRFHTPARLIQPSIISEQQAQVALEQLAKGTPEAVKQALERLQIDIDRKKPGFGPEDIKASQILGPIINELDKLILMNKQRIQTRPNTPALNQGSSLDSRILDKFSGSASQLATALTGDNKTITNLSSAVNNLTPVANDLKNAVTTLASLFKDGKIQLESKSTAQVDVKFDSALSLDSSTTMDNKSLNTINNYVKDTISNELIKLERKLMG